MHVKVPTRTPVGMFENLNVYLAAMALGYLPTTKILECELIFRNTRGLNQVYRFELWLEGNLHLGSNTKASLAFRSHPPT